MNTRSMAIHAKKASIRMQGASTELKNRALEKISEALLARKEEILKANLQDLERSASEKLAAPLLKRLRFDEHKLNDVVQGIHSLMGLDDPVGKTLLARELDEGLRLYRVSSPIGVIGIIFESRPDALVQISTLCLKSGNTVLLKGGREAMLTNRILAEVISEASVEAGMPDRWINLLESRDEVNEMLALDETIDLIIPRGSNEFVRYIMDHSRIPVLGHADGICHVYVDKDVDVSKAVDIIVDSKTQYVAVCNTLETLLVHRDSAQKVLPALKAALDEKSVEIRGCARTRQIIPCKEAAEQDWKTEYLDYILSIRIVDSLDDAIDHINTYGSGHTDTILSRDEEQINRFLEYVDSGNVFANCSTRFSDGFKYGFGAEVGISTNKVHARGPVGLEGLVTYKYKLKGNGHIVADYASGKRHFTHRDL